MIDPTPTLLESLAVSKALAEELRSSTEVTKETLERWGKSAKRLNRSAAALLRMVKTLQAQHDIEVALVSEAMHEELIDREGNAARVCDKQRSVFEQKVDGTKLEMASFDRVEAVVMNIENALGVLNACSSEPGDGCVHLAQ